MDPVRGDDDLIVDMVFSEALAAFITSGGCVSAGILVVDW